MVFFAGMAMGTARRTSSTVDALMVTPSEAKKRPKMRGVIGGGSARGVLAAAAAAAEREQPIKQNTLPHHREERNSSTESNRSQQQQQQHQTLPRHHRADREHHHPLQQQQQHLRHRDNGLGSSELEFNQGSADPLLQQPRGQLSWQGSPRTTSHRRRSNLYEGLSSRQHNSSYRCV